MKNWCDYPYQDNALYGTIMQQQQPNNQMRISMPDIRLISFIGSMASRKQAQTRINTLKNHYQTELAKHADLASYYQQTLQDLQARGEHLQNLLSGASMVRSYESGGGFQEPSGKSIASLSNISVELSSPSRVQKGSPKKKEEMVDFQVQYKNYARSIAKSLEAFALKQQQLVSKKPFQTGSRKNASVIDKSMKTSRIKAPLSSRSNISPTRLKTEAEIEPSKKEQVCLDLGNNSFLEGEDEIVNNLLQKLREEEEKYVGEVLTQSELVVKQKMKNYIEKQTEKNAEMLFNLKQQLIDKSLAKLQSNKATVQYGYTQAMRRLVEKGLRNRSSLA